MIANRTKERKKKEKQTNAEQRLIVIGASSGGFEAIKKIVSNLPADFETPIFIVWHISPDVHGILPQVLNRENKIYAAHAYDYEPIKPNRIYVAPPDYHMLIEDGKVRVTHGPKENRFRPAVDPLFRSAAYTCTNRVIGVILSGALDDGTAGLWAVKHYGGMAVVQDPIDAEVSSMPESALREVQVDYCVPVAEMADLLVNLSKEPLKKMEVMKDEQTRKEIDIAAEAKAMERGILQFDGLTPYTCPECQGVLSRLHNDNIIRYRCHTGHAYSVDALMLAISEKIEDNLYSAIRGIDEIVMLMNHIGDHHAEVNHPKLAAIYFQKAKEADERSQLVRRAVKEHKQVSKNKLEQEFLESTVKAKQ
ncbi:chemotaxis protein CheB [Emticicia sp. C21]|uniref:chemotaxis protein CheB n=1 Tax=Emticicia sp. C21 TaxID=2302915 RepID=UPI000E343A01|nr:chemotaxis protein CheB [Emticicia sp. C21]RFS17279.1 chemotaxis protein CheB [Emticicia sp. C21]